MACYYRMLLDRFKGDHLHSGALVGVKAALARAAKMEAENAR